MNHQHDTSQNTSKETLHSVSYDVIIIGAGPGGAFAAYELKEKAPSLRVLILEKGRSIEKRACPKRTNGGKCVGCRPCSITTGFSGAGAFSDGKLSLSPDVGGTLSDILGYDEAAALIRESDDIYLKFGADRKIWGVDKEKEIREIRAKAITANLKLVECPIRHLGTEKGYEIYAALQRHLLDAGVDILFNTAVEDILIETSGAEDGTVREHVTGVAAADGARYYAPRVIAAVGREGADWLNGQCEKFGIESVPGTVDIGVRVEVRDEVMQFLNDNLYEAKLIYHTPTFDDKVRTFCTNPHGEVATEYYDGNLAVVNGHAYAGGEYATHNTNFALLVSKNFTKPFRTPIEYGRKIAELSNMLCGNRIIVQTFGDFRRGRRSTEERMCRNNLIPTLKDAVPGDLSLVFPHRIMVDLEEMIYALDKVTPGIASDETLLYGVEVKFYSNRLVVNREFETSVPGLYAIGDGAGITRGLQQASANGLCAARAILAKKEGASA
ncbi:NAD(P)/FAD-dependent oxidoreductase [Lachnoclostridium sp. Marseille-P6806]|uniref:NAD(P)/FAD-dependent oxidoreductase n=1 Tax=Lachnoclostridium sp. Marseille-P6806 TaxID=2364793 RepID=UPI001030F016|nr:FAD-dependent oxidoreductase [Lachnoclostridium sp. Marseille-P6806]